MKCQALSQHIRHTPVVTDMLLQRFTIYHTRRCFLAFTSMHSIGSDLCPSSQALIHEDKTPAPPLHSYALIGQPARSRRACSQCARGVSGALGGSSVRSGSAARAQYNEENTTSPHRATLAKGVKEKERESLHLKTSHHIWTGSPQPGGGTRDLIYTVTFLFLFWGKDCELLRAKMMVGEMEVNERPRPSPDYLMQLLNEKKLMTSLPNLSGIFTHLERLLDEGNVTCV